jgi:hypothetical protein
MEVSLSGKVDGPAAVVNLGYLEGSSWRALAKVRAKSTGEHGDPWGIPQLTIVCPAGFPSIHVSIYPSASC